MGVYEFLPQLREDGEVHQGNRSECLLKVHEMRRLEIMQRPFFLSLMIEGGGAVMWRYIVIRVMYRF
jgi:hypothetical protein